MHVESSDRLLSLSVLPLVPAFVSNTPVAGETCNISVSALKRCLFGLEQAEGKTVHQTTFSFSQLYVLETTFYR